MGKGSELPDYNSDNPYKRAPANSDQIQGDRLTEPGIKLAYAQSDSLAENAPDRRFPIDPEAVERVGFAIQNELLHNEAPDKHELDPASGYAASVLRTLLDDQVRNYGPKAGDQAIAAVGEYLKQFGITLEVTHADKWVQEYRDGLPPPARYIDAGKNPPSYIGIVWFKHGDVEYGGLGVHAPRDPEVESRESRLRSRRF
jgi:hypothetical protein